jgi:hypothetical protein
MGWNTKKAQGRRRAERPVSHYFLLFRVLGELFALYSERQASAAAEGMPLSVTWTFLGSFLEVSWKFLGSFLFRRDFLPVHAL